MRFLALFVFLSCLIFLPIFFGKVNLNGNLLVSFYAPYGENLPFKNTGWDQLRIYFPFYKVTLDSIKNFEVPLWNPYAFSGHPHMADFQSAVFYPLNILGLVLPQIEFWHLLRITPTIMAAFFTYLYLRNLTSNVIASDKRSNLDSGPFERTQGKQARMTSKSRGFSNLASVFGALTFGFSPFILTWGEEVVMSPHSIVWLPLILLGIEKYLERLPRFARNDKKKYLAIIALSTAFSFFGGYMQASIYMLIFVFAYLVFRILTHSRSVGSFHSGSVAIKIICAFVLGAGIAAVQLLPSAELFLNAARSQITLREQLFNFLLPFESILTYFAPDFFGHPATANFFRFGDAQYYEGILFVGVAVLIFAGYLLIRQSRAGFVRFMTISGLVALLTTIDWFGAKLFISLPIPFLSTSIPNRVLFIPAFCLAVLAAGGFDRWQKEKFIVHSSQFTVFKAVLAIAGVYAGILVTLGLVKIFGSEYFAHKQFLTEGNILVSFRNLVIPLAVFATTVLVIVFSTVYHWVSKRTAAVLIIAVSFLHICYFSQKYFSFSERGRIFPENEILSFVKNNQGYFRSWGIGDAFFENNFASQYGIFWPEGYDSLNNRSYGELTYAMQGANIGDFVFRADAGLGRGNTVELVENSHRRRLVDLAGVKYVIGKIADQSILEKNNFKPVYTSGGYGVFENLTVMPRAFLASNYEGPPDVFGPPATSDEEIIQREKERRKLIPKKLLSEDFDFRNVLILEKPSPVSAQFGQGSADIVSYKSHEVIIKTESEQPKLLFLSDNWYPGWKATVDGDETEILRANYTFRAVPLIPGEHEVRFYYDPVTFKLGLVISIVSLGVLGLFISVKSRLVS